MVKHSAPRHDDTPYSPLLPLCCSQIFSLQDLAGDILTVMRLRLKRFLNFLETSPRAPRGLLASLDADTCLWVRSARDSEAAARGAGQGGLQAEKEAGEPLRSTHGVLLCLARALPRESRHKVRLWRLHDDCFSTCRRCHICVACHLGIGASRCLLAVFFKGCFPSKRFSAHA